MKTLEKGQEKIQRICDELRKETLEPAKKEAENIVRTAQARAQEIVREAELQAEQLIQEAAKRIGQERHVFQSSMSQGIKQSLEALKQEIEKNLFNNQLTELIKSGSSDTQTIAKLVDAIVKAVEKEGLSVDFSAMIPKSVSEKEVNQLLSENILSKLREKSVVLGNFSGGVQIRLHDKRLTLDISDKALTELLSQYVRKDFRKLIFADGSA